MWYKYDYYRIKFTGNKQLNYTIIAEVISCMKGGTRG